MTERQAGVLCTGAKHGVVLKASADISDTPQPAATQQQSVKIHLCCGVLWCVVECCVVVWCSVVCCACARARACVRACVRVCVCVRACVPTVIYMCILNGFSVFPAVLTLKYTSTP